MSLILIHIIKINIGECDKIKSILEFEEISKVLNFYWY